jgi:LssY C-terminus
VAKELLGRVVEWLVLSALLWGVVAYLVAPRLWKVFYRYRPPVMEVDRVTQTSDRHPGDPINIVLVGSDAEIVQGMIAAGWFPADPITFRSSVRIAEDTVLRRSDDDAPVSDLFLFGRKQDLAFEQPIAGGPRQRHHVRFWRSDILHESRPAWIGAATFDERVGLSYTTGQITHHIGPDVDAERDRIADEMRTAGLVQSIKWHNGFHACLEGRNGGGDRWRTDGRLVIVVMRAESDAVGRL